MSPNGFAFVLWLGIVILAILVWGLFATSQKPNSGLLVPNNRTVVSAGNSIYSKQCASCHGVTLEGQANWKTRDGEGYLPAPPHDETGHTWHHNDQTLFDLTKFGLGNLSGLKDYKTRMPSYEGVLSDKEIIAVLSFIKSTWPEDIQIRHSQFNQESSK